MREQRSSPQIIDRTMPDIKLLYESEAEPMRRKSAMMKTQVTKDSEMDNGKYLSLYCTIKIKCILLIRFTIKS